MYTDMNNMNKVNEKKEQISYKKFFENYLIFIGVLIVVFLILVYLAISAKKSWNKNLKTSVQTVLEEKQPGLWQVGNSIKINNSFTMNAACYEAKNFNDGEEYKVIMLRVVTYYGPLAGVFTINKNNSVDFIGFSKLHGRIEKQSEHLQNSKQITYWKNRIPLILEEK